VAAVSRIGVAGVLAAVALAAGLILGAPAARAASAPGPAGSQAPIGPASQCIGHSGAASKTIAWTQQLLEPSRLWSMTTGAGQTVAVLDSGVSATAPALAGAVLPGRNMLNGRPADTDCLGHGTFVAGSIAGRPVPGTSFTGMAPGATILPVDVVGTSSQTVTAGTVTAADLAAGIRYAVSAGASIIDVSAATTPGPSAALLAAVRLAAARNVVVIAPASGTPDSSSQTGQAGYPAAYPGVLAVSAVDSSDAPVASSGSQAQPDLAAPGVAVPGIGPSGLGQLTATGSAIATAFVAGTAALVRSYYPSLSAGQVVHRLEATADTFGTAVPSPQAGYGVVDPYTAVTMMLPEESGGRAPVLRRARPMRLPPIVAPDPWPVTAALIVCGAVLAGLVLAVAATHTVPHGRRRRWRPAPGPGDRARPEPATASRPSGQPGRHL
jgi:membrane-anchored mycosin MYCP